MYCTRCGYSLSEFDASCPKCAYAAYQASRHPGAQPARSADPPRPWVIALIVVGVTIATTGLSVLIALPQIMRQIETEQQRSASRTLYASPGQSAFPAEVAPNRMPGLGGPGGDPSAAARQMSERMMQDMRNRMEQMRSRMQPRTSVSPPGLPDGPMRATPGFQRYQQMRGRMFPGGPIGMPPGLPPTTP